MQLGSIIVTAQAAINLFLCSLAASLSWRSAALGRWGAVTDWWHQQQLSWQQQTRDELIKKLFQCW